jgi:hypothetical protein
MRTLITLIFLSFLSPATPHIDRDFPVMPATTAATPRWPLVCEPTLRDTVQFQWVAKTGETPDRAAITRQLTDIARQVNWLFWRDSDSFTEARLPAWKVTADCSLDVRFEDAPAAGTIPAAGGVKLIQIEPDDSYCGYAFLAPDDRPGPDNVHNGSGFAAVARRCLSAYVVTHELLHLLGAVQPGAPHGTEDFHTTQFDIMGTISADNCGIYDKIDCGNDDYFSLSPGDRFTNRWNSADSIFLVSVPKHLAWLPIHTRCKSC